MRVLHTADWHLGKSLEGQSRLEEQELFLQDFVKMARENRAEVVILAGDVYDSVNPPARAEKLFYDTLKQLSPEGERLIVVIAGNHDNPERLVAAGPLAMEHGIVMAGLPGAVVPAGAYGKHRITQSGPGWFQAEVALQDGGTEKLVMLMVPYPSEKRLAEVVYREKDEEQAHAAAYGERLNRLFRELELHYGEDTVNLMCAHLFAMGSATSGSERVLSLGGSYLIDGRLLPKQADYIALGHVHKSQTVPGTEKRARYAGAPIHYHKNEAAFPNVCILAEINAGEKFCRIKELPVPVYKPIRIWSCKSIEEAVAKCRENSGENSYVYLEIETERYIREDEMKEMKALKKDILEIRPVFRFAAGEKMRRKLSEQSMDELFCSFYRQEKGTEIPEETLQLFREMIEEEQSDEADPVDA